MLQTIIAGLPEGEMKEETITELMRKQTSQRVLSSASNAATPVSILDHELEIARLDLNITETVAFINSVEAHKATL